MNTAVTPLSLTPSASAEAWTGARLLRQLNQAGSAIWRALEAAGQARANRHLMDFADQCEAREPELAKELRAAMGRGSVV